MEKWVCNVCGYSHYGESAPDQCPKCGASRSQFRSSKDNRHGCILGCLVVLGIVAATIISCHSTTTVDNSTVNTLDLKRYLGQWYEVARFDHRFQRNMTQCTASYTMERDGTIKVQNRGMKNGKWKTSNGKVKTTKNPGILRVSFFGPFYSDYRVLMVAPDYTYALIGGNSDDYLWILSRTPQLNDDTRNKLLLEARRRGYQTDNLIWEEH